MRFSLTLLLAVAVLMTSSAMAGTTFTDPTKVNLLERWNANGTYYYVQDSPQGRLLSTAQMYKGAAAGLYGGVVGWNEEIWDGEELVGTIAHGIEATVVLGSTPMTLGALSVTWRDYNHTPSSWDICDQDGNVLASDTRDAHAYWVIIDRNNHNNILYQGRYGEDYQTHLDQAGVGDDWGFDWRLDPGTYSYSINASVTSLTFKPSGQSVNGLIDLPGFGAYLAEGQSLAIDGTTSVFYEEKGKMSVTAIRDRYDWVTVGQDDNDNDIREWQRIVNGDSFDPSNLYDGTTAGVGLGGAGTVEWTFSQAYTFTGAALSKYENNENAKIMGLTFEVSDDGGLTWTTVFGPTDVWSSGYLVFDLTATGDMFRMAWDDSELTWWERSETDPAATWNEEKGSWGVWGFNGGGGREIHEFQLFGAAIPEPATMSLLALGGLALLRRRRA
ncbi:MAG: PEP-CTERM sorting domain-containing protein [Phycisphaerae bacterium]|nr:PEP-CTERM sorting domain-containing protein [Phycisphaerae bacterium]